jgi:hypothetical protein
MLNSVPAAKHDYRLGGGKSTKNTSQNKFIYPAAIVAPPPRHCEGISRSNLFLFSKYTYFPCYLKTNTAKFSTSGYKYFFSKKNCYLCPEVE